MGNITKKYPGEIGVLVLIGSIFLSVCLAFVTENFLISIAPSMFGIVFAVIMCGAAAVLAAEYRWVCSQCGQKAIFAKEINYRCFRCGGELEPKRINES